MMKSYNYVLDLLDKDASLSGAMLYATVEALSN